MIANSYRFPAGRRLAQPLFEKISLEVLAALAIPLLVLALAAVVGNMIQHRLVWSYHESADAETVEDFPACRA